MPDVIWKFTVDPFENGTAEMPVGAKVIHVHEQNGKIRVWAECNPQAETVTRRFLIVPTGGPAPVACDYLGSVHVGGEDGRMYVFHLYDFGEAEELLGRGEQARATGAHA